MISIIIIIMIMIMIIIIIIIIIIIMIIIITRTSRSLRQIAAAERPPGSHRSPRAVRKTPTNCTGAHCRTSGGKRARGVGGERLVRGAKYFEDSRDLLREQVFTFWVCHVGTL